MKVSLGAVIGIVVGIIFRTFVPYLNVLKQNPETKFDKKFILPPIVSLIASIPLAIALLPQVSSSSGNFIQDFVASFTLSYTAQDITREVQKATTGGKKK